MTLQKQIGEEELTKEYTLLVNLQAAPVFVEEEKTVDEEEELDLPQGLSDWYEIEDERTKEMILVREWNSRLYYKMKAKISEISIFGEVSIEFMQPMKSQNAEWINETTLSVDLVPHSHHTNLSMLDFTWACDSFTANSIELTLKFENPMYISYKGFDRLEISIIEPRLFERAAFQDYLPESYKIDAMIPS